jgi:glycoside/pentoside/hexuronide:cation symporter, GPH family
MNSPAATLSNRRKLMFGLGDLTAAVPLTVLGFYQLYFMTDVALLPPRLAAWSILAVKLWDAVNDPILGAISDRLRFKKGRRRVPMLAASVPLGLSFALLWLVPPFGAGALAIWYTALFMLFDTCFTVFHVSFNALTPALARGYDERSSLNGYRMAFSIAGTLGAVILLTALGGLVPDQRARFALAGAGLGLFCMVPPIFAYRATEGCDEQAPAVSGGKEENAPRRESILSASLASARLVLANRPFRMVMGLYLFSWTTTAIISSALIYFVSYYFRRPEHANLLVLAAELAAIAFIPFVVAAAKRWDKRRAFIGGCASWIAVQLAISALGPARLFPAYLLAGLIGLGIATAYVLPWAMIPDAIEDDAGHEGSYYAFASFFQKLGTGAALWLMARTMEFAGYITPSAATPYPEQPAEVLAIIRTFMGIVPALLLGAAIVFAAVYPLRRTTATLSAEAALARGGD